MYYDSYNKTTETPVALKFLSCVVPETERNIILKIINTSDLWYKTGFNNSNKDLERLHNCSSRTVNCAITKAIWLGLQIDNSQTLLMHIPEIWEAFGGIWAEFYFSDDEDSKICEEVTVTAQKLLKKFAAERYQTSIFDKKWQLAFFYQVMNSIPESYIKEILESVLKQTTRRILKNETR